MLKTPKYSTPVANNKEKTKPKEVRITADDYIHKHLRVFIDAKITLKSPMEEEDRLADEFVDAIKSIITNARVVDPNVVLDCKTAGKYPFISKAVQVPYNHSELDRYITTGTKTEFKRSKPWQNGRSADEDGKVNPSVFFTMCWRCDLPPPKIVQGIKAEFQKLGGEFMREKDLASFDPKCFARLFKSHNSNSPDAINYELREILLSARRIASADDLHYQWGATPVSPFQQRRQVPQIPGLSSRMFENWPEDMKANRKVTHFECDGEDVPMFHSLIEVAKKHKVVEQIWGKGMHLSCFHESSKLSGIQRKVLRNFSLGHVEIQNSYTQDGLIGITALDDPVPVRNSKGEIVTNTSLRSVLYAKYKVAGDIDLFWEIHQGGDFADVDVIRPKNNEAKDTIEQMNKNIAAYLTHDLKEKGMNPAFINDLIIASVDPTLVSEVDECTWNSKDKTLSTPRDEAMEAAKKNEEAEWYMNLDFLNIGDFNKNNKKEKQVDRRHFQRCNDDGSFTTLNVAAGDDGKGKGYAGDVGMPVLSLGKAKASADQSNVINDAEDGVSALTGTSGASDSRKEVARLQRELAVAQAEIRNLSEPRLTANHTEQEPSSAEDSSSSGSSSSSSSSASSTEGVVVVGPDADPAA